MSIDDAATMRLQNDIWRDEGRLVDFVFNLQVLGSSAWESAEYIDCCHGHCHHHPQNGTEPQTILSLNTVDDVIGLTEWLSPLSMTGYGSFVDRESERWQANHGLMHSAEM